MRLVLDASAAVDAVVVRRDSVLDRMEQADLVAPALIDTEVVSALARLVRAGRITPAEADRGVTVWLQLPCDRVPTEPLVPIIWSLRDRVRITDAHYVAVARLHHAPILTTDGRLARAPLPDVSVLYVPEEDV